MPLLNTTPLVQLLLHIDTSWAFIPNPLLLMTLFSAGQALYRSFILCTASLSHPLSAATCDDRYLKQSTSSNDSPFSILGMCLWKFLFAFNEWKFRCSYILAFLVMYPIPHTRSVPSQGLLCLLSCSLHATIFRQPYLFMWITITHKKIEGVNWPSREMSADVFCRVGAPDQLDL